ncbi:MAG: tyrosinase family protein, partial [Candidatus Levyibacteriota bacterium]
FTAAYFGSDGNRNQNNHVTDGPFASWGVTREIGRDPQGLPTLPTQAQINQIMQYTNYDSSPYDESSSGFRNALEGWIGVSGSVGGHNRVHEYIGGDMATTTNLNSANDPVFWLVHADVDRIWWEWQQSHGQTNYQPTSGGPVGHNVNDVMQLLPEGFRPSQTFSTQSMGYTYQ